MVFIETVGGCSYTCLIDGQIGAHRDNTLTIERQLCQKKLILELKVGTGLEYLLAPLKTSEKGLCLSADRGMLHELVDEKIIKTKTILGECKGKYYCVFVNNSICVHDLRTDKIKEYSIAELLKELTIISPKHLDAIREKTSEMDSLDGWPVISYKRCPLLCIEDNPCFVDGNPCADMRAVHGALAMHYSCTRYKESGELLKALGLNGI